jgi:hypothetical protein
MMSRQTPRGGGARRWFGMLTFIALFLLLAVPTFAHAQAYNGAIVGSVTDSTGAAIVGAKVTVVANSTNAQFTTTTSSIGAFSLAQLPIGLYTVKISAPNFKEFVEEKAEVHVSTNTAVNAVLQPGAVTDTVNVQADAVQVETTSAAAGEVVSGSQVRELPLNGENFVGLTQLSPGVSAAASYDGTNKGLEGGVNFSVNGNPYTNNLFLVDGVNNNDVGSNRTILVYPAVDTIAEFKMIRNSFGPEYGQASGAIISLTTKSGTNQLHGGFFYAGRNDVLDSNNWFNNNQGTGKAKLRRNDWGYNASGPVIKNHLFVWWNQEWNREIRGASFGACVPTDAQSAGDFSAYGAGAANTTNGLDQCGAAIPDTVTTNSDGSKTPHPGFPSWLGTPQTLTSPDAAGALIAQFYPSPNRPQAVFGQGFNWASAIGNPLNWSEWNVRPDWDINSKNRVTFRWTQDSWVNPAPNVGDSFWGESDFPTVQSAWNQPSKSVMAKLSTTVTSNMVNDVEFGYGYNAIITTLAGTRASIVPAIQAAYPATFPSAIKQKDEFFGNWGGFNPYGSFQTGASFWNIAPYHNHEDLYTIQDNLSWVKGNHLLKAGAFYSDNTKDETNGNGADRPGFPGGVPYCLSGQTGPPASPTSNTPACVNTGNSLANALVPGTGTSPQMFASIAEGSQDVNAQVRWHDIEFYLGDTWKMSRKLTVSYGFRWSFYREPFSADNQWATWEPQFWSAAQATANPTDACNGLLVAKGTKPCEKANQLLQSLGVNLGLSSGTQASTASIIPNNNHDIAPRVGIVWDVFGNGKTAVRLGAGQFYQRELVGLDEGMEHGAPFSLTASSNRSLDTPAPLAGGSVSPNYVKELRAVTPHAWQWNSTIEQQVARNTSLEIGYVGNAGVHLTSMEAGNTVPQADWALAAFDPNGTGQNAYRHAFNFGGINGFAREGHATYHSLQTLFRSQMGPSTFQAAYTWSHSLGNVEEDNSSGSANQELPTVQGNDGLDKGNTNINRPNIFVANEVFYLPKMANSNKLMQNTVGGWELNSIFTAAHASSLTVFANGSYSNSIPNPNFDPNDPNSPANLTVSISQLIGTGYNGNNRPLTTGQSCNAGRKGNQILNSGAFTLAGYTIGTVGNVEHRGYCYGAPTTDWDAQLAKNWQIKERYRIKFSMDFFDLLNHPNFNSNGLEGTGWAPSTIQCGTEQCSTTNPTITSSGLVNGFGTVSTLQVGRGNRELQYALKFSF